MIVYLAQPKSYILILSKTLLFILRYVASHFEIEKIGPCQIWVTDILIRNFYLEELDNENESSLCIHKTASRIGTNSSHFLSHIMEAFQNIAQGEEIVLWDR